jgi:DNA (cytosine-5)-methyltransferase 1
MKFVDLFAGLGGFHVALRNEGHECVFASEIDEDLSDLYEHNFGQKPEGDIRHVDIKKIPDHDILCAGLPCQPFSKAGDQKGFDCPQWGDLYQFVIDVLNEHRPDFFILENVPNLRKHNDGRTWQALIEELESCGPGYKTDDRKLSPHTYGVPQRRKRIFVVGSAEGLTHFSWPAAPTNIESDLSSILDEDPEDAREMPDHYLDCMEVWQELLDQYPREKTLPSFPIWAMEFGATYDYEETTPFSLAQKSIQKLWRPEQTGNFGSPITGKTWEEVKGKGELPSHATREQEKFPRWKIRYIQQNRKLGQELRDIDESWFNDWIERLKGFPSSLQKFEWNCKGEARSIWKHVIQFRASGVRVKRATTAPSLVAMTTTQIPIIGWKRRYMTRQECARLQSLGELNHLPESDSQTFKALGNAVNATVVRCIAANLLSTTSTLDQTKRVLVDEGILDPPRSVQEELELIAG